MNKLSIRRILVTALSSVVLMASGSAHALFRSYISQFGSDASPNCTLAAPCRLLPAALAAVDPGGEVWMLDSANYNVAPVYITKSVTILAVPGALGSVVANGGDAIVVDTAGVSVTLRNLVVLNLSSGRHGINFSQGTRVIVEGCEIYGLPVDGIHATASNGYLIVKETTIRMNTGTGLYLSGSVTGTLSDSKLLFNNAAAVNVNVNARVFILDSLISNSPTGVSVSASGGASARFVINNSVIKLIDNSAIDVLAGAGSTVLGTVARSTITFVGAAGINVQNGAGWSQVTLDNNVIAHGTAVNLNNNSTTSFVYTRNNNTIEWSTGVINGVLTSRPGF
jgi:hypothetical protein